MLSSNSRLDFWNRRLHYYVGLYLLLFVWLFSISGLIINHPEWKFAEFWEMRKQEKFERRLSPVAGDTDLARARDVLRQLGVSGEIEWTGRAPKPGHLEFRAGRPGRSWEIDAEPAGGTVLVNRTTLNGWGALHTLHTFTGVRAGQPGMTRDWVLTRVWSFAMDAVAAGLAFMVASGCWVWFRSGRRRLTGILTLAAGVAVCAWFLLA
jgi:hypothetical protein